jgi:hypothetical protein
MRWFACLLVGAASLSATADQGVADYQGAIQRALIQRHQQSAEFAAQLRGSEARRSLESLHAAQLREAAIPSSVEPSIAESVRPIERQRMARDSAHVLQLAPPIRNSESGPDFSNLLVPLPLPGGPRGGVDPIAPQGLGN